MFLHVLLAFNPGLRWFLASYLETSADWVCGVRGVETSPPLNLHPKGVRRARAMLGDSETQDPWWCGGTHPPDMGRPTYGSARMVHVGDPNCRNLPWT